MAQTRAKGVMDGADQPYEPGRAQPYERNVTGTPEPAGRPEALRWSAENCTLGAAMDILGEKWSLLVLREVFLGIRRFEDLRVRTNIPRQVLTNRLASLVAHGLLRRHPYQEPGARSRDEYRLTDKGLDLYPVLVAILAWGDRYLAGPGGPALAVAHRECGAPVHVELRCEHDHPVPPRQVQTMPGPGARRMRTVQPRRVLSGSRRVASD